MHPDKRPRWRPDIQGLRALAVLGVLLFHAGVPFLPGGYVGVDVFFVISGFLITQNLLREHDRSGRIDLAAFFRGRIVRLAPAALATIAVTAAAVVLLAPPLARRGLRTEALAALVGAENLQLARTGTDYLAPHTAGAFQQFWSLGVEEQFYLLWALVLTGILAVPVLRRHLLAVTVVVCGASIVLMLAIGPDSSWTFFGLHTRAWELGAGALVAVVADRRGTHAATPRPAHVLGVLAAPLGIALILAPYVVLDAQTPFPSAWTLLSVLGAVGIVLPVAPGSAVRRVLGVAPLRWIGDRSYSLYLWHWPLLVVPPLVLGRALTPLEVTAAFGATLLIGWASHHVLEVQIGRWARATRLRPLAIVTAAVTIGAVLVPTTGLPVLRGTVDVPTPNAAEVLRGPWAPPAVPADVQPTVDAALADLPALYDRPCDPAFEDATVNACSSGTGSRTVVLFGDSHAGQWYTPVQQYARERDLRLVVLTKSSCPAASVSVFETHLGRRFDECDRWRRAALDRIASLHPALVVAAGANHRYSPLATPAAPSAEEWRAGVEHTVETIERTTGAPVAWMLNGPEWPRDPNECLSSSLTDVAACSSPAQSLRYAPYVAAERAAAATTGSQVVDPFPWLCTDTCAPVLWDRDAYRDTDHLTDAMATLLAPRVAVALDAVLADGDGRPTSP